ncbi:MAG TPA: glycosyltransferase [Moorella mulderi]|nr:glycosyltransferase [Moorella mulderi]
MDACFLSAFLFTMGLYYLFLYFLSLRTRKKAGENISDEEFFFFLLIPARDEERVIGETLMRLLQMEGHPFCLVVIDDGSRDATPAIVSHLASLHPQIVLLSHPPERSDRGKGAVLNYGLEQILLALEQRFLLPFNLPTDFLKKYDPPHIVIGVCDADARPSLNILKEVAALLGQGLGAVQTGVRIFNRHQNLLALMQDLEFAGFSYFVQKARSHMGSVGLGGNGQFVRLSSLLKWGKNPWGDTLTEDLELGLRLIIKGERLGFTDKAWVEQEGLDKLGPLLHQRARWLQGHLTNWKYIPKILFAPVSWITRLDTIVYLTGVMVVFGVALSWFLTLLALVKLVIVKNSLLDPFLSSTSFWEPSCCPFTLLSSSPCLPPLFLKTMFLKTTGKPPFGRISSMSLSLWCTPIYGYRPGFGPFTGW